MVRKYPNAFADAQRIKRALASCGGATVTVERAGFNIQDFVFNAVGGWVRNPRWTGANAWANIAVIEAVGRGEFR